MFRVEHPSARDEREVLDGYLGAVASVKGSSVEDYGYLVEAKVLSFLWDSEVEGLLDGGAVVRDYQRLA